MREIIFRGKILDPFDKLNGEWIYGSLSSYPSKDTTVYTISQPVIECYGTREIPTTIAKRVDPETIGEFTGMTDIHGNKIFEGDIVRTQPVFDRPYSKNRKGEPLIGVVKYVTSQFSSSPQIYAANWIVDIKDWKGKSCYAWTLFWNCEVVGNIYD